MKSKRVQKRYKSVDALVKDLSSKKFYKQFKDEQARRVQWRDEKIVAYLKNLICCKCGDAFNQSTIEEIHDAILKRVRAMGPKNMRPNPQFESDGLFCQAFNEANAEWRRRLGGR